MGQITRRGAILLAALSGGLANRAMGSERRIGVRRLVDRPIIAPGMDARMGPNIEGPSLIRTPDWLPGRLGRYYLYFADHKGDYIRLAFADRLEGPWTIHAPGSLQLTQSGLPTAPPPKPPNTEALFSAQGVANRAPPGRPGIPSLIDDATLPHIASPDVHVDEAGRRVIMYFHGLESFGVQRSRVAISSDGLNFEAAGGSIGLSYMRVFRHAAHHYAMAMPGVFSRSIDGLTGFETGPRLFESDQRHSALLKRGNLLHVFWTRAGDAPERIYMSTIDLTSDWLSWTVGETIEVLRPERAWEGAGLPVAPSYRSAINTPVNQLRDPAIYEENGRVYLLYAVKGEGGIGISELTL